MREGKFIVFEGGDGCGKSSNIPVAQEALEREGFEVVLTREPGGTDLGERIRAMLLNDQMAVKTELLLMFAARTEHVDKVIAPALAEGKFVLCDRYIDSTYAFQCGGRQIPMDLIQSLENLCQIPTAGTTLFFDLPVVVSLDRIQNVRVLDRFERESNAFHERVRSVYLERIRAEPQRFSVIDASRSKEGVAEQVREVMMRLARQQKASVRPASVGGGSVATATTGAGAGVHPGAAVHRLHAALPRTAG